ncbi:helix-turn-helix domain-containing protein [Metabacillus bambusae]|uniref:helix-turn-helix domain-containing protein n=1 Tax=Metabacillus bambusae TaxID=2795218 RepID=UPI002434D8CD|nr:helix-turn-helix transcriptional regulator [Metabacillus bambusae]
MIGKRIKKYRIKKNVSLAELGEKTGVEESYLRSIENNIHQDHSTDFLYKVSSVLGTPIKFCLMNKEKQTLRNLKTNGSTWHSTL